MDHPTSESISSSEAMFAAVFNAGPILVCTTRVADGRFTAVNDRFLKVSGYTRAELIGRTPVEVGLWLDPKNHAEGAELLRQGGSMRDAEVTFRVKDGSLRTCLLAADRVVIDGEPCLITVLTDITERKRAEQALRESEERFRRASDASGALVYDVDLYGKRPVIVHGLRRVLGIDPADVPLTSDWWHSRIHPDDLPGHLENLKRHLKSGTIYRANYRIRHADGGWIDVEDIAEVVRDEAGTPLRIVGAVVDVTERRQVEAAALAARAAAERAVQIRDQFLSVAAHELRNPLTTLLGSAQLIQRRARGSGLSERDLRAVQMIADQANRLNSMISDLLDASRMEMGQLTLVRAEVDLGALLRRLTDGLRPTLEQHALLCVTPNTPLMVEGDELRLEQIFHNLIGNAIKYSPAGGQIIVRAEAGSSTACVQVSDQGIGIPAEALPRLFQRFYRVGGPAAQGIGGAGIGLYVVRELVALHGGEVHVVSHEGQGSTFMVRLPLLDA